MLKILLYNSGIDKIPTNPKDLGVALSEPTFETLTTLMKRATIKDPCGREPYIESYNAIISKHVKETIQKEKIDLSIMQEVCFKQLPTLGFIQYMAASYEGPNKENPRALVVGVSSNKINNIETPLFLYDIVFDKNKIVNVPNNFMQVVLVMSNNLPLYVINVHRRAASIVKDEILFRTHMIGVIISILNKDPSANIIICGDYNSRGFPLENFTEEQENRIIKEFDNIGIYIDQSLPTYRRDIMTNGNLQSDDSLILVGNMLRLILAKTGFTQCIDQEECDIAKNVSEINQICPKKLANINDIIYYRFSNPESKIILRKTDICKFHLDTSAHQPYILDINLLKGINKIPDIVTQLANKSNYFIKNTYRNKELLAKPIPQQTQQKPIPQKPVSQQPQQKPIPQKQMQTKQTIPKSQTKWVFKEKTNL